ncbi:MULTISPECIES: lytic transglycosylase domain-containing protein [unclassified Caballeronia]|uniref:lytic transglycosylase domain-containing protein n=1 Tax=unclassified Caballeronia TaxID=2646786 RepID=UPI002027DC4F|nr:MULTISPECIES: lytic transglycosylase domain-containing protein [unclassified Caballeronia]
MSIRNPAFVSLVTAVVALLRGGTVEADCFDQAAAYHRVNPLVLRAIAWKESSNRANTMHKNVNGSLDYGVMQINSIHLQELEKYEITAGSLLEPCKNVYVAAWHLRRKMNRYGNTWGAIGAYHSETPRLRDQYAVHIFLILRNWGVVSEMKVGTYVNNDR